ncbi:MAG: hypothetical protein LBS16_01180 [Prevotellaceae bacterium]|jgi:hypothetical protein|nr:hypothetical protein [Prevotellaceae bacterium]
MPTSKSIRDKIAKLQAELKTQKEKEEREERDRKNDTKIKILAGAYLKSQPERWKNLIAEPEFEKFLVRDSDKKIFGFKSIKSNLEDEKATADTQIPNSDQHQNVVKETFAAAPLKALKKEVPKKEESEVTDEAREARQETKKETQKTLEEPKCVYLTSEFQDKGNIIKAFNSIFGEGRRGPDCWDFDKTKGQWYFWYNSKIDVTLLKKWLPNGAS